MNKEEIATKVSHWLSSRRHIKMARPVTVQIGRRFYPAARYSEAHKGVLQERLYVVGEMPPLQNRLRGVCYRTDHSDDGWHLLGLASAEASLCRVARSMSVRHTFCPCLLVGIG